MNIESLKSEALLEITNNRILKKFYAQWSVNTSKLIKQYAAQHSLEWYNTKWRQKSKEIPFYIRTKAPKTFLGNIWFASSPTNYAYARSVSKLKTTRKAIPKRIKVKPVFAYGRWFTPKKYVSDIVDVDKNIIDNINDNVRFFASKTSHEKTHKYKRPLLWYQDRNSKYVAPVTLKEQLADHIAEDPSIENLIMKAFEQTVIEKKYL